MSRDVLARALKAYRVESEEAEKRPAETLRRILSARQERRRVKPLLWVAMLTCSAAAAASIRAAASSALAAQDCRRPSRPASRTRRFFARSGCESLQARAECAGLGPSSSRRALPGTIHAPASSARRLRTDGLGRRTPLPDRTARNGRRLRPLSPPAELPARPEPAPGAASFDAEDVLFEQVRRAHDSVPLEDDLAGWERYLSNYPEGRFAPEARYRRALALARLGRSTEALSAFLWFTDREEGSSRREDALRWIRALSQEP